MATSRFLGTADDVSQVDNLTVGGTIEVGDIFNITVTGVDGTSEIITFTAATTTIADIVAGLVSAWNTSTNALATPITAGDASPIVTLTADTAGTGFSVTVETTEAGGGAADAQTFVRTEGTHNSGSSEWEIADNWSAGEIPGASASADIWVEGAIILYGLVQSGISNTLDSLNIVGSQIGSNGATGHNASYLQIKSTIVDIDDNKSTGTLAAQVPVNIDTGSTASTITVYNSGTNSPNTIPAVNIKANSASTVVYPKNGNVGIASIPGETSQIASVSVDQIDRSKTSTSVHLGSGLTVVGYTQINGTGNIQCATTLTKQFGGKLDIGGSGAITALTVSGGTCVSNTTGTISTAVVDQGGILDFTQSREARTVSVMKLDKPGTLHFDPTVVAFDAQIDQATSGGNMTYRAQ